ncbi:MAG: hypothetical protein COC01_06455 [Bacteroidetes bacterium]|nr:MAG: hypothetical protein COC01_06455 [Bacteroidota bacterium]
MEIQTKAGKFKIENPEKFLELLPLIIEDLCVATLKKEGYSSTQMLGMLNAVFLYENKFNIEEIEEVIKYLDNNALLCLITELDGTNKRYIFSRG